MLQERMINSKGGFGMIGILLLLQLAAIAGVAVLPCTSTTASTQAACSIRLQLARRVKRVGNR